MTFQPSCVYYSPSVPLSNQSIPPSKPSFWPTYSSLHLDMFTVLTPTMGGTSLSSEVYYKVCLSNSNRTWKYFAEANFNSATLTLEIFTESLIIVEIPNYQSRRWMKFAWGSLLFDMLEWTAVKLHSRFLRFNLHEFFSSASEPTCSFFVYWCSLSIGCFVGLPTQIISLVENSK